MELARWCFIILCMLVAGQGNWEALNNWGFWYSLFFFLSAFVVASALFPVKGEK